MTLDSARSLLLVCALPFALLWGCGEAPPDDDDDATAVDDDDTAVDDDDTAVDDDDTAVDDDDTAVDDDDDTAVDDDDTAVDDDDSVADDDDSAGDDDDSAGDDDDIVVDDDDSTPIDDPPTAPVVDAPAGATVGVATTVTITAGTDPEGGQIDIQCTSPDSNYDAVAYDDGLGAGGRTIIVAFTWTATGSKDVFCVAFDAGGQPSAEGQDTVAVTAVNQPPGAPSVYAPPSALVGSATAVTVMAGIDPEGALVNVQCTSSDSNYDAVAYDDGLGAGGRAITLAFTWTATGSHDVYCTSFDAAGLSSSQGQDTVEVTSPTGTLFQGIPFVLLAPDTFAMGCLAGRDDLTGACGSGESPSHAVTLTHALWVAQTETTQAQFEALMGYNPAQFGPNGTGPDCGPDCPVETVSWHEAAAFANALSAADGLGACYSCTGTALGVSCSAVGDPYLCDGYRLPTEAEWEYAARGGEDAEFSGSDVQDWVAWTGSNSVSMTHPAGLLQGNAFDIYDMSGNVWEWTSDWYSNSYYSSSPADDPSGPSTGAARVLRGGSWDDFGASARAAARFNAGAGGRYGNWGFRLSRSIP